MRVASEMMTAGQAEGPDQCRACVAVIQGRWLMLHRALALCTLAAVACVAMAVLVGLDAVWRGGHLARGLLCLVWLGVVMAVIVSRVRPLWAGLPSDRAALLLEAAYPQLAGRALTALQLASPQRRTEAGVSDRMYQEVCRAAERFAAELDPRRAVPGDQPLRRMRWAVLVSGVVLLMGAWQPPAVMTGLARILMPWKRIDWPLRTRIELAGVPSNSQIRVVRGGTLSLSGRAAGQIPRGGVLRIQAVGAVPERALFDLSAAGEFEVRYRPVNTDLTVWLEIGDARSDSLVVRMVSPPEIAAIEAECRFAAYTRLPTQRVPDGNVQAVVGSEVLIRVTSSKPLQEASLAWEDAVPVKMLLSTETICEASFQVTAGRSYQIHLTDGDGFHNADPVTYRVEMIDNQYPRFERSTPTMDKRVSPAAVLPITATISDDFGVTEVALCYRLGKREQIERTRLPIESGRKRLEVTYAWPLLPLALPAGESLTYWLEARDDGPHANVAEWPATRARRLQIVDEAELARSLAEQAEQVLERLTQLHALQSECADAVGRVVAGIKAGPVPASSPAQAIERAQSEKWRQDRLARTAGQLAERLAHIAEDQAISRIGQPERISQLKSVADRLARIGGSDMPAIVLSLDEAMAALGRPATRPQEAAR